MNSSFTHDEKDKNQVLHEECPRKLNLNLPLLSTKRPASEKMSNSNRDPISNTASNETRQRVPFSWERAAGEPKDKKTSEIFGNIIDIPLPPKPPPGRWQPYVITKGSDPDVVREFSDFDDGCDADVDDECNREEHDDDDVRNRDNGCLSDTIDIFSLAESVEDDVDIEEKLKSTKDEFSRTMFDPYNDDFDHSPDFIIRRFLPDAQALAAASVMNRRVSDSDECFARAISFGRSCHSPKGCGLGSLFPFPWRMRPKTCSLKSPVREPFKRRNVD